MKSTIIGHVSTEPGEWYGMWCVHGNRLMGPITDPLDEYSFLVGGQIIIPWGCPEKRCTPGPFEYALMHWGGTL